jgi:hypothetical protein
VLILRRFDRGPDGERMGYVSAMTLTGLTDGDPADYLDLAAALGGGTGAADEREALLEAAPYFGMTPDRSAQVLAEVASAAATWRTVATSNGIPERELRTFADVLPTTSGGPFDQAER